MQSGPDAIDSLAENQRGRLSSWKEIGAYLGCDARTAQRWEKSEGLPVHRHQHARGSSVYAYAAELDVWLQHRSSSPAAALVAAINPAEPPSSTRSRWPAWVFAGMLVCAATLFVMRGHEPAPQALIPVPLTSWFGAESGVSFSPDGSQIAFTWNGEHQDNFDIYVMDISSGQTSRLTSDPLPEFSPVWSPDGSTIAFVRPDSGGTDSIVLMPAKKGPEHVLAHIVQGSDPFLRVLDWHPGGGWLAVSDGSSAGFNRTSIMGISVSSGAVVPITRPPASEGDGQPTYSADGGSLAFVRDVGQGVSQIWVARMKSATERDADAHPLALEGFEKALNRDPRWTADGREIVFASNVGGMSRLWRVSRDGGTPVLLTGLGEQLSSPAVSARARRLAYSRRFYDTNIWRFDLSGANELAAGPTSFIASTFTDDGAQFSPDGNRIVFVSQRSGFHELWICRRDGSDARQLTRLRASVTGSPKWSPDGRYVVFDSRAEGQPDIYVTGADGTGLRRLTTEPAADIVPTWSPDGRWIYFASSRSGELQIWRVNPNGGAPEQITHDGGFATAFSPDGKWLFFTKYGVNGPLWKMPLNGDTPAQKIVPAVRDRCFAPAADGMLVIAGGGQADSYSVLLYPWNGGEPRTLGRIARPVLPGLAVSPDGKTVLYSQLDRDDVNLMLVENWR